MTTMTTEPDASATPVESPPAPPPPAELGPALSHFEAGDFRSAHATLAALRRSDPAPEVAAAATALAAQLAPDPWAVRVGLLALGLLALVSSTYLF